MKYILALLLLSIAAQAFSGEAETKLPSEKQVRSAVARLTAPKQWAASERFANGEGEYDGEVCAPGLRYERAGSMILSMSMDSLHLLPGNPLMSFEELGKLGVLESNPPENYLLFCDGMGFDLVQIMGKVALPPFENAGWLVADHGQDSCGATEIIIYATHGASYVALLLPIEDFAPGYKCDERYRASHSDAACPARVRCLQDYLAAPGKRAAIESALRAATSQLSFSWK